MCVQCILRKYQTLNLIYLNCVFCFCWLALAFFFLDDLFRLKFSFFYKRCSLIACIVVVSSFMYLCCLKRLKCFSGTGNRATGENNKNYISRQRRKLQQRFSQQKIPEFVTNEVDWFPHVPITYCTMKPNCEMSKQRVLFLIEELVQFTCSKMQLFLLKTYLLG